MNPTDLAAEVPMALRAWGILGPDSVAPVPGGTLNWNFRVETGEGVYDIVCNRRLMTRAELDRVLNPEAMV